MNDKVPKTDPNKDVNGYDVINWLLHSRTAGELLVILIIIISLCVLFWPTSHLWSLF